MGPVSTGSLRRRLILKLSQKDTLQALFQQNPYPGIATRERLARELALPKAEFRGPPSLPWVTQPPRGNPGYHGHPGHALVFSGGPCG
ncbi:hypothetical protein CapIbe_018521 [Capra ibex]